MIIIGGILVIFCRKNQGIVLALLICFLMGCSGNTMENDYSENEQNVYVSSIKEASPETLSNCKYGDVFDEFFISTEWEHFKTKKGNNAVEFIGYCNYRKTKVKARIEFILAKDEKSFEVATLELNDVPQTDDVRNSLLYKAFMDYVSAHDLMEEIGVTEKEFKGLFFAESEPKNEDVVETTKSDYQDVADINNAKRNNQESDKYILPESSIRYLENSELPLLKHQLRLARNEIFARHGRMFKDKSIQKYFDSMPWYVPSVKPERFNSNVLNEFEKYNIDLISSAETSAPEGKNDKNIYFAGIYRGIGTITLQEYSTHEETAHGRSMGYVSFDGFGDWRDGKQEVLYENPDYYNSYDDRRGFLNIVVEYDRIFVEGCLMDWENSTQYDVSGEYRLIERFPLP